MSSILNSHGCWQSATSAPAFAGSEIALAAERVREPAFLVQDPETAALSLEHDFDARIGVTVKCRLPSRGIMPKNPMSSD